MTSETIIRTEAKKRDLEREKVLIENCNSLWPAKNKFLFPDNYYSKYAKKLRSTNNWHRA